MSAGAYDPVAAFLAEIGARVCPPAACAPTVADLPTESRSELEQHETETAERRRAGAIKNAPTWRRQLAAGWRAR